MSGRSGTRQSWEPEIGDGTNRSGFRERVSEFLNLCSGIVILLTVCCIPWYFGGTVPAARLILLVGAVSSSLLRLTAVIAAKKDAQSLPTGVLFPAGLAMIGIVQLMPVHDSPPSEMAHAVYSELRESVVASSVTSGSSVTASTAGTVSPARTRLSVAQWLSVSLLVWTGFDVFRTSRAIRAGLTVLAGNSFLFVFFSFVQLFRNRGMIYWQDWVVVEEASPSGAFLNPNGAAGWLCIHLSIAVALTTLSWVSDRGRLPEGIRRARSLPGSRGESAGQQLLAMLARLNTYQILSVVAVAMLFAGAAATRSRAGILAAVSVFLVSALVSLVRRRFLVMLVLILVISGIAVSLLTAFEEDQVVVSELSTLSAPIQQISGRLRHWSEVLVSVRDFPLLGSGMGCYRFTTLPYLRWGVSRWFQQADNQFVEMAVESGVIGFLLYCGFGILLLYSGLKMIRASESGGRGQNHSLAAWGVMCVAIAFAQAISATFDYSPGGPAALAAVAVISGMAMGAFDSHLRFENRRSGLDRVIGSRGLMINAPGWSLFITRVLLAAGAVTYVPDVLAAHGVFRNAVAIEHQLMNASEESNSKPEMLQLRAKLERAMQSRPDDPYGLEMAYRIEEALFRDSLIRTSAGGATLTEPEYQKAWSQLNPIGLASRVQQLRLRSGDESAKAMVAAIQNLLIQYPIARKLEVALSQVPLMPGLRLDLIATKLVAEDRPVSQTEVDAILFGEPASPRRLYQLGHLLLLRNQKNLCLMVWQNSLRVSGDMRVQILADGQNDWTPAELWQHFGSQDYCEVIRIAESRLVAPPDHALRKEILQTADQLWQERTLPDNPDRMVCRGRHLRLTGQNEAAVEWIRKCLVEHAGNPVLRRLLAEILEAAGRTDEAESEWLRIQHFSPNDVTASTAIRRLREKQRKP